MISTAGKKIGGQRQKRREKSAAVCAWYNIYCTTYTHNKRARDSKLNGNVYKTGDTRQNINDYRCFLTLCHSPATAADNDRQLCPIVNATDPNKTFYRGAVDIISWLPRQYGIDQFHCQWPHCWETSKWKPRERRDKEAANRETKPTATKSQTNVNWFQQQQQWLRRQRKPCENC